MESVCCSRMRLLAVRGDLAESRRLGRALLGLCTERGLRRTAMRAHALGLAVEHAAGGSSAALAHLDGYLAMYAGTDYARALVRDREAAAAVLAQYVDERSEGPRRRAASRLLEAVRADPAMPDLTVRQRDVLARLATDRDDDIAAALGLTRRGVRYPRQQPVRQAGSPLPPRGRTARPRTRDPAEARLATLRPPARRLPGRLWSSTAPGDPAHPTPPGPRRPPDIAPHPNPPVLEADPLRARLARVSDHGLLSFFELDSNE